MRKQMMRNPFTSRISEAYQIRGVYRPINWNPSEVLTDARKEARRKRHLSVAIWILSGLALVVFIASLSLLKPVSYTKPETVSPNLMTAPQQYIQPQQPAIQQRQPIAPEREMMTGEEVLEDAYQASQWLGC